MANEYARGREETPSPTTFRGQLTETVQPWWPYLTMVLMSMIASWMNESFGTCCYIITAAIITIRVQDSQFNAALPLMIPFVGLVRVATDLPVAAATPTAFTTTPCTTTTTTTTTAFLVPSLLRQQHQLPFPSRASIISNSVWEQPPPPRPIVLTRRYATSSSSHEGRSEQEPPSLKQEGMSRREMLLGGGSSLLGGLLLWGSSSRPAEAVLRDDEVPRNGFRTKSGLKYYDIREGEGVAPKWGQVCIVHYEGYCRTTPKAPLVLFDDTYSRNMPYLVKHGNGRLIKGFEEGLHTMKLGGYRRIVIPLSLGYTRAALGPFPPNSLRRKVLYRELKKAESSDPQGELVFDVELLSVYDDEADQGYYVGETVDNQVVQEGLAKTLKEFGTEGMKMPTTGMSNKGRDRFPFNQAEWDTSTLPEVL